MTERLGVELTQDVRPPVTDSTLGIEVTPPAPATTPAHRLVTIGDSLTHGFQHLAIFNTDNSWPMMVARQLDIAAAFSHPVYDPKGPGGRSRFITLDSSHRIDSRKPDGA